MPRSKRAHKISHIGPYGPFQVPCELKLTLSIRLTAMSHVLKTLRRQRQILHPGAPYFGINPITHPWYQAKSEQTEHFLRQDQKNLVSKNPHQSTLQKLGKCPKKALNLLCRIHTAPPGHCNQSCPPDTQIQIKLFNQIFPLHNRPFLYGCVIPQTLLPLNDRF